MEERFDKEFAPCGFIEEDEEMVVPKIKAFINQEITKAEKARDEEWRKRIKGKLESLMEVPEDKFFGKSEFDNVYEAYRIIILGEALDSLLERKHG